MFGLINRFIRMGRDEGSFRERSLCVAPMLRIVAAETIKSAHFEIDRCRIQCEVIDVAVVRVGAVEAAEVRLPVPVHGVNKLSYCFLVCVLAAGDCSMESMLSGAADLTWRAVGWSRRTAAATLPNTTQPLD